jgi:hypothetical protein
VGLLNDAEDFLRSQDTGGSPVNPPMTLTASSHSIVIKTDKGIRIGRIQNWSPSMARTVDSVYEVQANAIGEPIERVPQVQGTNSISVDRYELYTFHLGEAFGTPVLGGGYGGNIDLVSLVYQIKPFHVREIWRDPTGAMRAYIYANCWFSNMGHTISATDDRIIKAKGTIEFTRRLRLV